MSTFDDVQDPMARLRAANPVADGSGPDTLPPVDILLGRLEAPSGRRSRGGGTRSRVVRLGVTAIAIVAAVAAIGTVALTGAAGERTDVVAEARAALAPRGEIVHSVVRSTGTRAVMVDTTSGKGAIGRLSGVSEQWTATDPLRSRHRIFVTRSDDREDVIESTYAAGVTRSTVTWDNDLLVSTLAGAERRAYERQMASTTPTQLGPDPIQGLHQLLEDGVLHPTGEVDFRGRRVLRLVGRQPAQHFARGVAGVALDVEYLVDPKTYAPVSLVTGPVPPTDATGYKGEHPIHLAPPRRRLVFETYERIPLTDKTSRLLRLPDTAGRKIVHMTAPARTSARGKPHGP